MRPKRKPPEGIRVRHSRRCPGAQASAPCKCKPSYEAWAYSKRDGKKIRKTFANLAEAKLWRADARAQVGNGSLRAPKPTTIKEAWAAWHAAAKAGTIRNRSGDRFKPSTLRAYSFAMGRRVLPDFGATRLTDVTRRDLNDLVERLLGQGLSAPTIQVTLLPLRAIYGRAVERNELTVNPTVGLAMPRARARRARIADPAEAAVLIAAVPEADRAVWATACYAGLRRGELMGLRCEDVDLAAWIIRVERGWDDCEGEIEPKSRAGRRRVPIVPELRELLIEHRLLAGRTAGLIFGRDAEAPFTRALTDRAKVAWKGAGLRPIGLHECRHTFASLMIAAGVNAKALSTFMGHGSVSITFDLYGHLMPGSEAEAAELLHTYLRAERERAEDAARTAEVVA